MIKHTLPTYEGGGGQEVKNRRHCRLVKASNCMFSLYLGTSDNGHSEEWTTSL